MSKTVLLGLFDGLHRGHASAIDEVLRRSGEKAVFTFDSKSLYTKGARGLLMTDRQKASAFRELGFEVISADFAQVKDMSPREFVRDILAEKLSAASVVCGENFRFGKGGQADSHGLERLCGELGIAVTAVPLVYDGGEPISTTRIRGLIQSGDISSANRLLGYRYGFEGSACTISEDIVTAVDGELVCPKDGRYSCCVCLDSGKIDGITEIIRQGESKAIAKTRVFSGYNIENGKNLRIELINQIDV